MYRYRFVTPHRTGKWYPDLATAQRFAETIGAGFLEARTGKFVPYRDTRLEVVRITERRRSRTLEPSAA
jgi:hypothetical protein